MSKRHPKESSELVEALFRAAEHQTSTEVGAQPGTIVRTAMPREGLVRPKVVWVVVPDWPASLDEAFSSLQALRDGSAADRAICIVDGDLPEGQQGSAKRGPLDVMTLRRFAFELANIDGHLADLITFFDSQLDSGFVARSVTDESGEATDAVRAIVAWCERARADHVLWLVGSPGSGRSALVTAAAAKIAERFFAAPDTTRPLISKASFRRPNLARFFGETGWVILGDTREELDGIDLEMRDAGEAQTDALSDLPGGIYKAPSSPPDGLPREQRERLAVLRVKELATRDVVDWLAAQAPSRAVTLRRLAASFTDFGSLLACPRSLSRWRRAVTEQWPADAATDTEVVVRIVATLLGNLDELEKNEPLPTWALQDFAIGSFSPVEWGGYDASSTLKELDELFGWSPIRSGRFTNNLLRDYFVARKIIADVRADRREILTRYQFPREFVLLFLAVLSPDVAALTSEDRSKAMHDEIAAEVEREVQLALAHNLKHPINILRGALADMRKKLPGAQLEAISDELSRVERCNSAHRDAGGEDEPVVGVSR